jgi:hypothetical protein
VAEPDYRPWDVDIDTSRAALERLGRALVETGSQLTDSMLTDRPIRRGVKALLRVQIPRGQEWRFDELCKWIDRRSPPRPDALEATNDQQ